MCEVQVILFVAAIGDDNFYGGVSGSPAYDSMQSQQHADTLSPEEKAFREQEWRAELAKVSFKICIKSVDYISLFLLNIFLEFYIHVIFIL